MPKYEVIITETLELKVTIEADSLEEAYELAEENTNNSEDGYVLDADHFVGREFEVNELTEEEIKND